MNKKIFVVLPLFASLLVGCKSASDEPEFDPFMIGDNLEVINSTEAQLIANKAYNNLVYVSSLKKNSVSTTDETEFYTGAFSSRAKVEKLNETKDSTFYTNKIFTSETVEKIQNVENGIVKDVTNTDETIWYGIKPVKQGEAQSENYSTLCKTVTKNGDKESEYYSVLNNNFSNKNDVASIWNRYIVAKVSEELKDVSISYSDRFTYVRDNKHIVGYFTTTTVTVKPSEIAPEKSDISYVKRTDELSVIDFYEDSYNAIGWTIKSISKRRVESYLTSIDGAESNPIETYRNESVTSLVYEKRREKSDDIPQYKLDASQSFYISKFIINKYLGDNDEEVSELVYSQSYPLAASKIKIEEEDGHAFYLVQKLSVGYYAFYDDEESEEYEKWGYDDIDPKPDSDYIISPFEQEEYDSALEGHNKLFYVAEEATFLFRIVFNHDMSKASEFRVAFYAK